MRMHTNGHDPAFRIDDLSLVRIPVPIFVAGYQADTSNSLETNAPPGTSPIARVIHTMVNHPFDLAALHPHPAGQMASAYTHFMNLDSHDPLYRFTMGVRVASPEAMPPDIGVVEIPPGQFLCLMLPGPFHTTIPAAWDWLINLFADGALPWHRTYTGDLELYDFGPDQDDSRCGIYVAVEAVLPT